MIEFRQTTDYASDYATVSTGEENLEAICDTFRRFLLACGFTLPEGAHIGYEYDNTLPNDEAENDRETGKFCRCDGNQTTECGEDIVETTPKKRLWARIVTKCHWMFDKGLWLPDCGADVQPTDFPPSGYCPHCGNEIEVIEVDDERPEAEPLDAIVARLSKRVAELESAFEKHTQAMHAEHSTNVRDGSKSYSTIEQNPTTNTTDSEVTGANAQRSEQSSTIGKNMPIPCTPEQVVGALRRQPWEDDDGLWIAYDAYEILAYAVRELAWGFEVLRKSGPSEPGAWMRVKDIARAVMEAER